MLITAFGYLNLAVRADLIPNHVNEMWIDPLHPGLCLGQWAQFCGMQHAKMLLRVHVDAPEQFSSWVKDQRRAGDQDPKATVGRHVFETQACMNCHTVADTAATGRFD